MAGSIPRSLGELEDLTILGLGNNKLNGKIQHSVECGAVMASVGHASSGVNSAVETLMTPDPEKSPENDYALSNAASSNLIPIQVVGASKRIYGLIWPRFRGAVKYEAVRCAS